MKVTDTLGRDLIINLMVKDATFGWLPAPDSQFDHTTATFLRLPHGEFAFQVFSRQGCELMVFVEGRKRLQTVLPEGPQIVDRDGDGKPFYFTAPGAEQPDTPVDDIRVMSNVVDGEVQVDHLPVPSDPGAVFVVARFAEDKGPLPHPPREEFPIAMKMMTPAEYDDHFARNLSRVVLPPALLNSDDPVSFEPPADSRPHFVCTCTGAHRH